ncbi:MAG: hypothetical protein ACI4PR_03585 [Acutalibacteraceae bacterium]
MLDSNLIKKYSKLGMWSKLLAVLFFVVLAIGVIIGYIFHNNIYATSPSDQIEITCEAGTYNGDNKIPGYTFSDYFSLASERVSQDDLEKNGIKLKPNPEKSNVQCVGLRIDQDQIEATFSTDADGNIVINSNSWETYWNLLQVYPLRVDIVEYRKVTFNSTDVNNLIDKDIKKIVFTGTDDGNDTETLELNKDQDANIELKKDKSYIINFGDKSGSKNNEIDCLTIGENILEGTEDNTFTIEVTGDMTISVNFTGEVKVSLGMINGKNVNNVQLGTFVSQLKYGWLTIYTLGINENDAEANIKYSLIRSTNVILCMRDENFQVESLTYSGTNNNGETITGTSDATYDTKTNSYAVKINNLNNVKELTEIKVNIGCIFENKDVKFINDKPIEGVSLEDIMPVKRVFTGYDVIKTDEETWELKNNCAEIELNDRYTFLKGSLAKITYTNIDKQTASTTIPITQLGSTYDNVNKYIVDLSEMENIGGITEIHFEVNIGDTLFNIEFESGTGFKIGDGIASVKVDDRECEIVKEFDDQGKEKVTKYITNAFFVKGDQISAELEVELTFNSGYTLQSLENEDLSELISQLMSLSATPAEYDGGKKSYDINVSDIEEDLNGTCKFNLRITGETPGEEKDYLKTVNAKLNLVFRSYTVQFVDASTKKSDGTYDDYDDSVFSISTSQSNTSTEGSFQSSYETKKNYIRCSSGAENVPFKINLGKNYIDCQDKLSCKFKDDSNGTIVCEGGTGYFTVGPIGLYNHENIIVEISGITPNIVYAPETIERDDVLKEYGVDVGLEISGYNEKIGEPKEIYGKTYYPFQAVGSNLSYKITGDGAIRFTSWAKSQEISNLFTKSFFDEGRFDNNGSSVAFNTLNCDGIGIKENGEYRLIDTQLKGPDLQTVTATFTINPRYEKFFKFIVPQKDEDGSWNGGTQVTWEESGSNQIKATVNFKYHPMNTTEDQYVGLELNNMDFDFKDMVSDMVVEPDGENPEGMTVNYRDQGINVFPEDKYKIMKVTLDIEHLSSSDYNFRILNIKYPKYTARVNSGENMAQFSIVSGFLTDTWNSEISEDEGTYSVLSAYYNYDSDLTFTIQANTGYEISNVEKEIEIYRKKQDVDARNSEEKVEYRYFERQNELGETVLEVSISNVTHDLYIYVDLDPAHKTITHSKIEGAIYYRVEKDEQGDYWCKEMILGRNTVPEGSDYYFAVESQTGYNIDALTLSSSDSGTLESMVKQPELKNLESDRSAKIRVFELKSVSKNQVISGKIEKNKCKVSFNLDKEYPEALTYKYESQPLGGSRQVEVDYGESVEFSVEILEKYNRSDYRIMLFEKGSTENGKELNLVNNIYSISNITGDKDVRVENIEINKYSINLVKNDAAEYLDSNNSSVYGVQTVEYNGNYIFELRANEGYSIGESVQVMCMSENGTKKALTPDKSGKYKLSNVKEDFIINILNVDDIYYTVTLVPTEGVTYVNDKDAVINEAVKVKHGSNFEFGVNVDDAYDDSKAGMYIVINDGKSQNLRAQILYSGRYTINNITEDASIKVGNIRKNTYTVTLNKVEGMDFYDGSNKIISGDNTVSHGDSLSFKVNLYPAYSDSNVKIMLGTQELSVDDSGFYTVKNVIENKIVTVNGVEETIESQFINTINNLPDNVSSFSDVDDVISASRTYENLTDEQKARVGNIDKLKRLQEQVKTYHHTSNGVTVDGADWNIKLFAIPLENDMDVYTRLYKKLSSEYILSLYNVYLWDTIKDERYTLPEGKQVVISLPTPEMTYFEKPTGIHEKESGKLDYLSLILGNEQVSFTTDSFSPMGIIASRSSTPGRSSLLDAIDADVQAIKEYALSNLNSSGTKNENTTTLSENIFDDGSSDENNENTGNISEKFKSRNNPVTARGSAIRLLLVLLILILLTIIIIIVIENMKKKKEDKNTDK